MWSHSSSTRRARSTNKGREFGTPKGGAALAAVFMIVFLTSARDAGAAEMLMFVRPGCIYCELWRKEIGPIYPKTPEGRLAPLRELYVDNVPTALKLTSPIIYTPTFVIIRNDEEVGRITGYPGADFFWSLLSRVLLKATTK